MRKAPKPRLNDLLNNLLLRSFIFVIVAIQLVYLPLPNALAEETSAAPKPIGVTPVTGESAVRDPAAQDSPQQVAETKGSTDLASTAMPDSTIQDRLTLFQAVRTWKDVILALSITMNKDDLEFMKTELASLGMKPQSPFSVQLTTGKMTIDGLKGAFKIENNQLWFDGHAVQYVPGQTFAQNYERIGQQLNPKVHGLLSFPFIDKASAQDAASAKRLASGWTIARASFIGFWVCAVTAMVKLGELGSAEGVGAVSGASVILAAALAALFAIIFFSDIRSTNAASMSQSLFTPTTTGCTISIPKVGTLNFTPGGPDGSRVTVEKNGKASELSPDLLEKTKQLRMLALHYCHKTTAKDYQEAIAKLKLQSKLNGKGPVQRNTN